MSSFQNGGSTTSPNLSWNPNYWFCKEGYAGLNLGVGGLKDSSSNFLEIEYQALAGYLFHPNFGVEVAFGAQSWTRSSAGSYGMLSVTGYYKFSEALLKYLDRVFVTYSEVPVSVSEVKVGVGLSF